MAVLICAQAFDPLEELRRFQQGFGARRHKVGALATFVGSMRDFNEGDEVASMVLEHYPGMTERHLEDLAARAATRWGLADILIVHRVGEVLPGDDIVLVATWSAHRAHAFESCRAVMEELKSTAPFWKKERTAQGERWVTKNTPGTSAAFESS